MKERWRLTITILLTVLCLILLPACQEQAEETTFLQEADLSDCELYIYNVTCQKIYEVRTVDDDAFLADVTALCATVTPFRPLISSDIQLGGKPDAYFLLEDGANRYFFEFFDAKKQLDLDYAYRDSPMIAVGKDAVDENGQYKKEWRWYCTLSPAAYAELYDTNI